MSPTVPTFEHGRQLRLLSGLAGERVFKHSVVGPRYEGPRGMIFGSYLLTCDAGLPASTPSGLKGGTPQLPPTHPCRPHQSRRCNLKRTIHASATTSGSTLVEEEVYMERFNGYRRQGGEELCLSLARDKLRRPCNLRDVQ